eukprot:m.328830 g.328830  ORF g.328830 m.328830 type:complete len:58 (+) comp55592_c0_seq34:774-947(+)
MQAIECLPPAFIWIAPNWQAAEEPASAQLPVPVTRTQQIVETAPVMDLSLTHLDLLE